MSLAATPDLATIDLADLPSRLNHPSQRRFELQPFFTLTTALLRAVRQHDFETLSMLCDDDAGIVDVDPSGSSVMIRDRAEWENWFRQLFGALDALGAETDSLVLDYRAFVDGGLGWSMLEFRQFLEVGDLVATFDGVATIIWKRTPDGWREAVGTARCSPRTSLTSSQPSRIRKSRRPPLEIIVAVGPALALANVLVVGAPRRRTAPLAGGCPRAHPGLGLHHRRRARRSGPADPLRQPGVLRHDGASA